MVSSSSLVLTYLKTIPDENTQLFHIYHISRLVKLEIKAHTCQYSSSVAHYTSTPSHHLVLVLLESCTSLMVFMICVFIFEVFKKAICCLEKVFLHNIINLEWLLVLSKDVTDAIGSNSCSLTQVLGLVMIDCCDANCAFKSCTFMVLQVFWQGNPSHRSCTLFYNAAPNSCSLSALPLHCTSNKQALNKNKQKIIFFAFSRCLLLASQPC